MSEYCDSYIYIISTVSFSFIGSTRLNEVNILLIVSYKDKINLFFAQGQALTFLSPLQCPKEQFRVMNSIDAQCEVYIKHFNSECDVLMHFATIKSNLLLNCSLYVLILSK